MLDKINNLSLNDSTRIIEFEKLKEEIDVLKEKQEYQTIISLLERNSHFFPEKEFYFLVETAEIHLKNGHYEQCFEFWRKGHTKNYFFGIGIGFYDDQKIAKMDEFEAIKLKDKELWQKAITNKSCCYEIIEPHNFDSRKEYPVIMIFHGGGSSNKNSIQKWKSSLLDNQFIKVFVESYLHYSFDTFGWRSDDKRAWEDIHSIYKKIESQYAGGVKNIIVGGISAGALIALEVTLYSIIPTKGFIAVCPIPPKSLNDKKLGKIASTNISGFFILGDQDFAYERQLALLTSFDSRNIEIEKVVNIGMKHAYPQEFACQVDKGVDFLLRNKKSCQENE